MSDLQANGWAVFAYEEAVATWAKAAREVALTQVNAPELQHWLRCEGTWFVGVDALPNDPFGQVGASQRLSGTAFDTAIALYGTHALHPAQVSVIYPGYPRPREGEGDAAFAYRLNRDAAHVDGLLPTGPEPRRHLMERHAYILGLPLSDANAGTSPLTIWQGSHRIMRAAFEAALGNTPEDKWPEIDLTDIYKAARREVFATCTRHVVPARPGEAYLVHRHALHGVAPWRPEARAPKEGRMIAYFRPELPMGTRDWLEMP